jgi:pseudaminic acid cytidylyltransferase
MANLAIIPARGGSKRIPKKNIKDFLGKPIIAYSILTAIDSGLFDEVMVSTDDEEIALIAKGYGAQVPFLRSSETSNDFSSTIDVLKEVESKYKVLLNKHFDNVCCIYPTAPLIEKKQLIEGLNILLEQELDSVFPVVAFSYPIQRGLEFFDGKIKMVWPEHLDTRSQDLKEIYHDAGQWYWYKPERVSNSVLTNNSSSLILDASSVQDIDNIADWNLAEMKYKIKYNI